jgi:hypothetical protein
MASVFLGGIGVSAIEQAIGVCAFERTLKISSFLWRMDLFAVNRKVEKRGKKLLAQEDNAWQGKEEDGTGHAWQGNEEDGTGHAWQPVALSVSVH